MAVIALESVPNKGRLHRDPNSYRWEARINDYSAGLMQLHSNTARQMVAKYELGVPGIDRETLCIPSVNIIIGATYLMHLGKRSKTSDGVLLQAAFNAGGVYFSAKNEWRLRTHAPDRTYRYMQWHNDAVEVLRDH
jgi:peptidoglycan L-alanyl-D-glutamate endopeptidase CwlK